MTDVTIDKHTDTLIKPLDLQYLLREPLVPSAQKKAIVLLHGVGSNEADLFSLASQLPPDFHILSARGLYTLSVGRYAWYNVDFSSGEPVYDATQEAASRKAITHFVKQVKEQYQLDEIYIGGFSQGAIMSFTIGLTQPNEVQGVIALSGRLLEEIRPVVTQTEAVQKLKVFLAHGTQDSTLPIHFAREAKTYLQQLAVQLNYHEYPMGHQITPAVLQDLNQWLTHL